MQINVMTVLTDLKGESMSTLEASDNEAFVSTIETPKETPTHQKKTDVTLRLICVNTLLATTDKDRNLSGKEKLTRFKLASKIQDSDVVELTAEEITLLKKRIGELSTILVTGKAYELLEPKKPVEE